MKKKQIVTIGGGTGSFTLLTGLKEYPVDLTAVVSMADDGGSTGKLRDELGVLPPGDVRQCLVALSNSTKEMRELMNYRFTDGTLKGHNFGNLLISALEKVNKNMSKGIEEAMRILNVKGFVLPVTHGNMRLFIELQDGSTVEGEDQLDYNKDIQKKGLKKAYLKPRVTANPLVIQALKKADYIILGPGDQYGSIIPNLLVSGVGSCIQSSRAKVIYNCNLTNKKGQTTHWNADDYVQSLEQYIGKNRINYVIYNTSRPDKKLLNKYERREGKGSWVHLNTECLEKRRYTLIQEPVMSRSTIAKNKNDMLSDTRSFIRHDSERLAKAIMKIVYS
jgi:uncharacterized cofD-like protein